MGISAELLIGVEDKERFKREYEAAKYLMEPLKNIINKKIAELRINRKDEYKEAAWPYYRADKDGSIRAYEEILKLLP